MESHQKYELQRLITLCDKILDRYFAGQSLTPKMMQKLEISLDNVTALFSGLTQKFR